MGLDIRGRLLQNRQWSSAYPFSRPKWYSAIRLVRINVMKQPRLTSSFVFCQDVSVAPSPAHRLGDQLCVLAISASISLIFSVMFTILPVFQCLRFEVFLGKQYVYPERLKSRQSEFARRLVSFLSIDGSDQRIKMCRFVERSP